MSTTYQPKDFEQRLYQTWEKSGYFKPAGQGEPYCIMIPPPNVTGSLHMGHAFQQTLMDILVRYHRMLGKKTLWQVGTDHAGIATQMVVERQLLALGKDRHQLGRESFITKIWEWKNESGNNITRQLRRMGASVDWDRERFTMDEGLSHAVQDVFLKLYEEGLIYRGKRLVNWDPALGTAVSDLEVEAEEEDGFLWHISYPLIDNTGSLTVATTRPETLLGDVAVAVHPEDERYASFIGKTLKLPLTDREIPVIADKEIDKEFGTGCVKITPAHDFNDYLIGERHHLPKINILNKDATLNENVPEQYRGLDRFEARRHVLRDLKALALLVKEEPHKSKIPRGDRSGVILEPLLTDQWFVKMEGFAKPALQVVKKEEIRFIPENWRKTYFEWLNNIQDWCISRQIWWGHRIPAWYDANGNIYVGRNEAEVRQKYSLSNGISLNQDEDVLDTWFSSALWPFSTLGWPKQTEDFNTFYPTQVLITGFDIIFFWVARMIMFGLKFTGKIPFQDVYINGLILDQDGQKMSKTKGNVLDPIDLIDGIDLETLVQKRTSGMMQPQLSKHIEDFTRSQFPNGIPAFGTDALRFTFAAIATNARYIRFDLPRIDGYRHFCNKLWNAARYVMMNANNTDKSFSGEKAYSLPDRFILSLWQQSKESIRKHIEQYRFDLAAQVIYDFTWNEYCDWYLELSKPALSSSSQEIIYATRHTLVTILEELLRVIHPIMPFITEEIWQQIKGLINKPDKNTIMLEPYPAANELLIDVDAESEIAWVKSFILGVRSIRGEMNIAPGKLLPLLLDQGDDRDRRRVNNYEFFLKTLAKLDSIHWFEASNPKPPAATALVGNLEILIPMQGLIDVQAEMSRLQKEIDKFRKDLEKVSTKLANPNFLQNAPKDVVAQDQKRMNDLQFSIDKLNERKHEIERFQA